MAPAMQANPGQNMSYMGADQQAALGVQDPNQVMSPMAQQDYSRIAAMTNPPAGSAGAMGSQPNFSSWSAMAPQSQGPNPLIAQNDLMSYQQMRNPYQTGLYGPLLGMQGY
jgi:hypothetical protein